VAVSLLAVLVALACLALGRWQWHRFEDKHHRKQLVARNYDAAPVPLASVLKGTDTALEPALQWRQVRVVGRYDVDGTTLVRNRPRDIAGSPVFGYEVLVPLVLDDGSALLVDRGWLPNGTTGNAPGQAPDTVPPPPPGRVEVVARLRPSEPRRTQRVPRGQVGSIAVRQVEQMLGRPLYGAYGVLVSESPSAAAAPEPIGRPVLDGGEGINASYAVQWWLFAAMALGFPVWFARRRPGGGDSPGDGHSAGDGDPVPARRRRIWDDEDE
jgi:cytochrome oxidase assembly protein ShyY1